MAAPSRGSARPSSRALSRGPASLPLPLPLPLPLTEARGLTPELALRYDSGNGNGSFGFGFSLDVPAISRRTDKGILRYDDKDTFLLTGADHLVPELVEDAPGDWRRIYQWNLEESRDPRGNRVVYEYRREDARNVPSRGSYTRTWYHTGVFLRAQVISRHYAGEVYDGDPVACDDQGNEALRIGAEANFSALRRCASTRCLDSLVRRRCASTWRLDSLVGKRHAFARRLIFRQ